MNYTRGYDENGNEIKIPYSVEHKNSYDLCVIKKEDIKDAYTVDIVPELTRVKDENGYIIAPLGHRTVKVALIDESIDDSNSSMPGLMMTGGRNELGTHTVILDGDMKCEALFVLERHKKLREGFFRFELGKEKVVPYGDIIFRIYTLPDNSDYNEMADIYRDFKRESGLKSIREKNRENLTYCAESVEIRVRMAWKPVPSPILFQTPETEPELHVSVTFDKLMDIMRDVYAKGVRKAQFCLVGWNISGHDGRYPQIFPVEEKLGGEKKLREAIALAKKLGYKIVAHTNSSDAYTIANNFEADNMILNSDGTRGYNKSIAWGGGRQHYLCPKIALENAEKDFVKLKDLGFDGTHYIDVISIVRPCYCFDENHYSTRSDTVKTWKKIMDIARNSIGGVASEGTFDTVGDEMDFCLYGGINRFKNADKEFTAIPLWELVYHGSITYCPASELVNIPIAERKYQLKLVEFGGRPALYVNSRFVTETSGHKNWMGDDDLRVGTAEEYEKCVETVQKADEFFEPLKYLQFEYMIEHKIVKENVVRVTYSDGSKIYINYNNSVQNVDGITVNGLDYIIAK